MLVMSFLISLAVMLLFCKDLVVFGSDADVANRLGNERQRVPGMALFKPVVLYSE